MKFAVCSNWLSWPGLAVLAGLAWGLFLPAPLQASCGDYVVAQSNTPQHDNAAPSAQIPSSHGKNSGTNHELPTPRPCASLNCTPTPAAPGSMAPPLPERVPESLCLLAASCGDEPTVASYRATAIPFQLSPHRSSIFDPPRRG